MSHTIIPAQPGYYSLYMDPLDPVDVFVDKVAVIAWAIVVSGSHHDVTPVTATGDLDGQFLQYPGGQVYHYASEQTFDTQLEAERFMSQLEVNAAGRRAGKELA